jgi:hypothetical protein
MSEVGDDWRAHRDYLRSQGISRRSVKRPAVAVRITKQWQAMGFRACTEWHWQARIGGVLIDYWPSKSKWSLAGMVETGPPDKLLDRIKVIQIAAREAKT